MPGLRDMKSPISSTAEKWRYCDNYWVLPSDKTIVEPVYGNMPLFGIAQTEDIIRSYRLEYGWNGSLEIPRFVDNGTVTSNLFHNDVVLKLKIKEIVSVTIAVTTVAVIVIIMTLAVVMIHAAIFVAIIIPPVIASVITYVRVTRMTIVTTVVVSEAVNQSPE